MYLAIFVCTTMVDKVSIDLLHAAMFRHTSSHHNTPACMRMRVCNLPSSPLLLAPLQSVEHMPSYPPRDMYRRSRREPDPAKWGARAQRKKLRPSPEPTPELASGCEPVAEPTEQQAAQTGDSAPDADITAAAHGAGDTAAAATAGPCHAAVVEQGAMSNAHQQSAGAESARVKDPVPDASPAATQEQQEVFDNAVPAAGSSRAAVATEAPADAPSPLSAVECTQQGPLEQLQQQPDAIHDSMSHVPGDPPGVAGAGSLAADAARPAATDPHAVATQADGIRAAELQPAPPLT